MENAQCAGGRGRSFTDAGTWGAPSVEIIGEVVVSLDIQIVQM